MKQTSSGDWSIQDSIQQYGIDRWGDRYFSVDPCGHVVVHPNPDSGQSIDLKLLVDRLCQRGLELPILIRFNGILRDRLDQIDHCFKTAIDVHGYANRYRCVFPIKVNQQREVVQQIAAHSATLGFGIEAGSKPELLAAIAMSETRVPIICNGFKDREYVRLAMMAGRIGRTIFPVIEKASELNLILQTASEFGVRPSLGFRVKLATRGSGRWQASGGYRSKFGLTVAEVLAALDHLIAHDSADCFQLLHFHVGSQIGNIRHLKSAIVEASRIYTDLYRRGAAMGYMDVGGGLGIDYDGSFSDSQSSINYTMQEYANDVVFHVKGVCDDAGVPHPELLSESGRAISAQHSVLVVETLGVTKQGSTELPDALAEVSQGRPTDAKPPAEFEKPIRDLWEFYRDLTPGNARESFHDAQLSLDMCMNLFSSGYVPLEQRVLAENLYFALCHRVREMAHDAQLEWDADLPDEFDQLDRMLSDIYFVNFSIFQSMPDSWAIGQLFPIMPIHRLNERPTRNAVLGDITCDSDGKVDMFVCGDGHSQTLPLHRIEDERPYQIGIFLVGAYQEILGDLHNLFGDTHAVHVECENDSVKIRSVVKGDRVSEVLEYVQYDQRELIERLGEMVEQAVSEDLIDNQIAGQINSTFEQALGGYTYLGPVKRAE